MSDTVPILIRERFSGEAKAVIRIPKDKNLLGGGFIDRKSKKMYVPEYISEAEYETYMEMKMFTWWPKIVEVNANTGEETLCEWGTPSNLNYAGEPMEDIE